MIPKVVQIQAVKDDDGNIVLYALRDDGSIWVGHYDQNANKRKWTKLTTPTSK